MAAPATRRWTKRFAFPYERVLQGREPVPAQNPMNDTSQPRSPAIALTGINLSLGRGAANVHILKDIDLDIGAGEAVGLVGPSGSGKSTLLMVMAGLERPGHGAISVAGHNLNALDE